MRPSYQSYDYNARLYMSSFQTKSTVFGAFESILLFMTAFDDLCQQWEYRESWELQQYICILMPSEGE